MSKPHVLQQHNDHGSVLGNIIDVPLDYVVVLAHIGIMERATDLLHAFYNPAGLSASDRQQAHNELVLLLRNPGTADDAARYITGAAAANHSVRLDAVLLHYSLHALEERARSAAFGALSGDAVRGTVVLLISFVVSAYRRNTSTKATPLPQHVVVKAARTAAAFGRREWAAAGNANAHFPRAVLHLVDRDGGDTPRVPELLAGITLLTVLVDDALDDPRAHMLAAESHAVRSNLKLVAPDILAALEVGLRIKGPGLPDAVPLAAARSIASIVRVHPPVAPDAAALLRRCVVGIDDRVTAEMMAVLADLFGESNAPLNQTVCHDAMLHVSSLLEAVAMGETAKGESEAACLYRVRLVAYAEAVAKRVIGLGVPIEALERLFNGLMGTVLRWAEEAPNQLPAALDAWISIFETIDDCEVDASGKLMQTVLQALSQLCVQRCMYSTNAKVLALLDDDDDDGDDNSKLTETLHTASDPAITAATLRTIFAWDYAAEIVDNLGTDSSSVSTAFLALAMRGDDPEGAAEGMLHESDGVGQISRALYISKCVEALVVAAQSNLEQVGVAAAEFAVRVMSQRPLSAGDEKYNYDIITGTNIAYSMSQLFPADSPPAKAILEAVVNQLRNALQQPARVNPASMFAMLRTAASLTRLVAMQAGETVDPFKKASAETLSASAVAFLQYKSPPKIATAAAFLLLLLEENCGTVLYATETPFVAAFAPHNRQLRPVCALGAMGIVQWTLLKRGPRNKKWSDEEMKARTERFSNACVAMFGDFVRTCRELKSGATGAQLVEVSRGAALLRTVITAVLGEPPQVKEILWAGVGRDISGCCLEALGDLKRHLESDKLSEGVRQALFAAMSCVVGTIRSLLTVCRRQVRREAGPLGTQTIQLSLDASRGQGSARLARVLLQLLLDHVVCAGAGDDKAAHMQLVSASVDVAARAISEGGDGDLARTAVAVLTEVMSRYWLQLWPADAVQTSGANLNGTSGVGDGRNVFFASLRGVLSAARRMDLEVSRAGLLALETLNASRKLYSRDAAFRACGAAQEALVAAFEVLGASGDSTRASLADEAHSVVWGIASVDLDAFYKEGLPTLIIAIAQCAPDDVRRICSGLTGVSDRPTFVKGLHALVNDLAFFDSRKKTPVL